MYWYESVRLFIWDSCFIVLDLSIDRLFLVFDVCSAIIRPHFGNFSAGHFSFGTASFNTARPCISEQSRCDLPYQPQHFIGNSLDFPLCTVAATMREEIVQASCVHGDDNRCLAGIRQNKTRVLLRFFQERIVFFFIIFFVPPFVIVIVNKKRAIVFDSSFS